MTKRTDNSVVWRRAGRCSTGACVEVAKVGNEFWVRDSKNPAVGPLRFSEAEWAAFVEGVGSGDFSF